MALILICLGSVTMARTALAVPPGDDAICLAAIATAEQTAQFPPRMLYAIALAESGRAVRGANVPWPWTIDINGVGRVFDSKAEAIAAVSEAQHAGTRSIDVGCMQINLFYHPQAFANLDDAFDPAMNVAYAVRFLGALRRRTSDWGSAIAAYHSATAELGLPYAQRVAILWPDAARFGVSVITPALALEAALEAQVDPSHQLTPAFRAQRMEAALRRRGEPSPIRSGPLAGQRRPGAMMTIGALEDEVDPKRILTPAFRAEMVAAAALRHRREAAAAAPRAEPGRLRRIGDKLLVADRMVPP